MMALQKPQRTDFSRKSIARIIYLGADTASVRKHRRCCEHARCGCYVLHRHPVQLGGATDEGARDIGRLQLAFINGAQRSGPRCHASRAYDESLRLSPSCLDNRMRSTFGGNAGSSRTSSRSSMKCVQERAAMRASFSARVLQKIRSTSGCRIRSSSKPFAAIHLRAVSRKLIAVRIVMAVFGLVADN